MVDAAADTAPPNVLSLSLACSIVVNEKTTTSSCIRRGPKGTRRSHVHMHANEECVAAR